MLLNMFWLRLTDLLFRWDGEAVTGNKLSNLCGRQIQELFVSYNFTAKKIKHETVLLITLKLVAAAFGAQMIFNRSIQRAVVYLKCCSVYTCAYVSSSWQACKSAKALMPRQFEGWSCAWRKSQHASRTSTSCSMFAAGRSTCNDDTHHTNQN